jgi:hypothetical protein
MFQEYADLLEMYSAPYMSGEDGVAAVKVRRPSL